VSSPDSNNRDESSEAEAGGRTGSDPIEAMVTPAQILQALTGYVESSNAQRESTESRLAAIESCLLDVVRVSHGQTQLLQHVLTRPADPASSAEPLSRQVLQVERGWLWSLESGIRGTQARRMPRPSIIGRALYDLQYEEASVYEGSKPADIYITISVRGPHHLSETASRYVTRYEAGETSDMAGKIGIHFESRFEVLTKRIAGRIFAGRRGELRCLTGYGINLFADWPHWDARDDDPTGDGPSPSGSPAPAPAGGTGAT
jgi:hypothetical protein